MSGFLKRLKTKFRVFGFPAVVFIFGLVPFTTAQTPGHTLFRYTDENGLPQNSVKAIAKDPNGFLWLATESGLVRFDGQSFFTYNKSVIEMPGNRMRYLLPATSAPNPQRPVFYALGGDFNFLAIYPDSKARPVENYLSGYMKSVTDQLTKGFDLRYIPSLPDIFLPVDPDTSVHPDVNILPVGNERFYIRYNTRIEYHESGKLQFTNLLGGRDPIFYLKGELYSQQRDGSLVRISPKGPELMTIQGDITRDPAYRKEKFDILWNNVTHQGFLYHNKKIYLLSRQGTSALRTKLVASGFDARKHTILSIYMDEYQNIFLGSFTEGLYVLRRANFKVTTADSPKENIFYALASVGDSSVMTHRGHIFELPTQSFGATSPPEKTVSRDWASLFLEKDADHNTWVIESSPSSNLIAMLSKYDAAGKVRLGSWQMGKNVRAVYANPFGEIWAGVDNNKLYRLKYRATSETKPVLFGNVGDRQFTCFLQRDSSLLWIGTTRGLYQFDIRKRKLIRFSGLANKHIRSIHSSEGNLWITTYDDGIFLFRNNRFTQFPMDGERNIAAAHCMVEDKRGYFWVTTNKGLFRISKADLINYADRKQTTVYYEYYDKSNGFNTNEFNGGCQPCGSMLRSGSIVFPSLNGIVYFNPDSLITELPDKILMVSQVVKDGQLLNNYDTLRVDRKFGQLKISVSTPYFGQRQNVQIRYSISNSEGQSPWLELDKEQDIYLTGLRHGQHVLRIGKANGFGHDNFMYKDIVVIVSPYWYETTWFTILVGLLIVLLFLLLLWMRSRYLIKKNYQRHLLNKASVYGDIITAISHDIQTPMHYVTYSLGQVVDYFANRPDGDPLLSRMVREALVTVEGVNNRSSNLLEYLRVNLYQSHLHIKKHPLELNELISQIAEMFSAEIARKAITFRNQVPQEAFFLLNSQLFSAILHNLIDNALKVSKNGTIELSLAQDGTQTHLMIKDSGKGMPRDLANWMMDKKKTIRPLLSDNNSSKTESGGLGLLIVKDLCLFSGIDITISIPAEGGTIILLAVTACEGNEISTFDFSEKSI